MGKAGNPATRAAQEAKISSVADLKKKRYPTLTLPSGAVMRFKNPGGMKMFMTGGLIPNSLMGVVQESLKRGKTPNPEDLIPEEGINEEFVTQMSQMMDNIFVTCALEPPVHAIPLDDDGKELPPGQRGDDEDEKLFVDEFPEDDKMFIFQWASGGTTDLERFREQQQSGLAAVAPVAKSRSRAQ